MEVCGAFYLADGLGILVKFSSSESDKLREFDFSYKRKKVSVNFLVLEGGEYILLQIGDITHIINQEVLKHLMEHNNVYIFILPHEESLVAKDCYTFSISKEAIIKLEGMLELLKNFKVIKIEENEEPNSSFPSFPKH